MPNQGSLGQAQDHREAAKEFLRLVATGRVRDAYAKYISPELRHHNPFFRGDAESLMIAMEENAVENPNKDFQIQRVLQDGDLVAVHSRMKRTPTDHGVAVIHIFRFKGNLVVELWDIGQAVPENSPNENGMF